MYLVDGGPLAGLINLGGGALTLVRSGLANLGGKQHAPIFVRGRGKAV